MIGGSLASTLHGEFHGTLDSDLVADLAPQHLPLLVEHLADEIFIPRQCPFDRHRRANRRLPTARFAPYLSRM